MLDLVAVMVPARPKGLTSRVPIPASTLLRPLRAHELAKKAAGKYAIYICESRAGRPRAWHDFDLDGECIHCDHAETEMDQRLGGKRSA